MRVVVLGRTPGKTSALRTILCLEDLPEDTECCKHTAEIAGRKVRDSNAIELAATSVICFQKKNKTVFLFVSNLYFFQFKT